MKTAGEKLSEVNGCLVSTGLYSVGYTWELTRCLGHAVGQGAHASLVGEGGQRGNNADVGRGGLAQQRDEVDRQEIDAHDVDFLC